MICWKYLIYPSSHYFTMLFYPPTRRVYDVCGYTTYYTEKPSDTAKPLCLHCAHPGWSLFANVIQSSDASVGLAIASQYVTMDATMLCLYTTAIHVVLILTHWGWDKMAAFSQTTSLNAFSWMKMYELRLKIHWNLFLRVQLTISQHWFR